MLSDNLFPLNQVESFCNSFCILWKRFSIFLYDLYDKKAVFLYRSYVV